MDDVGLVHVVHESDHVSDLRRMIWVVGERRVHEGYNPQSAHVEPDESQSYLVQLPREAFVEIPCIVRGWVGDLRCMGEHECRLWLGYGRDVGAPSALSNVLVFGE